MRSAALNRMQLRWKPTAVLITIVIACLLLIVTSRPQQDTVSTTMYKRRSSLLPGHTGHDRPTPMKHAGAGETFYGLGDVSDATALYPAPAHNSQRLGLRLAIAEHPNTRKYLNARITGIPYHGMAEHERILQKTQIVEPGSTLPGRIEMYLLKNQFTANAP